MVAPADDTDDLDLDALRERYAGRIRTLEPGRGGTVAARDGRVLPFTFGTLRLTGDVTRPEDLRPGLPVTFDLSHTRHGPHVTWLRVGSRD